MGFLLLFFHIMMSALNHCNFGSGSLLTLKFYLIEYRKGVKNMINISAENAEA